MASSKRFPRSSRLACLAMLGLALAAEGHASVPSAAPASGSVRPVSMVVDSGVCKPGYVEGILNNWLVATKDSQFESDYATLAFYRLVDFVYVLRDIAQDFCV